MKYVVLFFLSLNTYSVDICDIDFINKNAKSKELVAQYEEQIASLGKVLYARKASDCSIIKELANKDDHILIDARGMAVKGKIRGALRLTSDHDNPAGHKFKETVFEDTVNKYIKKRGRKGLAKDSNYVIFCNGATCYRTLHAACTLNKRGYKPSQLNLILDGYDGLHFGCKI